ncbi:MAG: Asp-tRNA(Asn)/Glu-tRNA(Gln) amidotransferase subunit GatC [Nitrososphaeraceae archaeon]|nr:Asp-tRNA(Asn)/Glu-tRNA(Gln) amidotransferase subunit GatC [Nitrososphaeraceae archaeon]MBV9669245.1 Asp-tRNA(Asn)/Glu-tRNA(Gln) amidotransferase subunit GatC [Nitrososphaeraceae archaeon]
MISNDEIKHLGWLSRLELTDEEIVRYALQIEEVIKYLNKLDSISLSEVEPVRLKKKISELRKDDVKPFEGDVLEVAKNRKNGYVKGPRMV